MTDIPAAVRPPAAASVPLGRVGWLLTVVVLAVVALPRPASAQGKNIPLPPPPPGTKRIPLPPPPPGMQLVPRAGGAPPAEKCTGCHGQVTQGRVVHGAMEKHDCKSCHKAVANTAGKCKSRSASKWVLVKQEPELCYGCHARKDQSKAVHTVVRQGSCLGCHTAHTSPHAGRLTQKREQICFDCHELESLGLKAVTHAPVAEGRCLDCHDAHGGSQPNNLRGASGGALCLKCHDSKAPTGKGTPAPGFRVDLTKKVLHPALKRTDCLGCHDGGHGSDNLRFLKKNAVDLCYGCHERKDKHKFPHSAVVLGDCAVCHDPHSSDTPKLLAKATSQEMCFLCHQDDLTGRKVIHAPAKKGCDPCHDAHGSQNRHGLKAADGKAGCYKCHKPVDTGKVKHAPIDRYGCTGCHDPHGTAHGGLLSQKVNTTCVGCHPDQKDGAHVTPMARNHPVDGNLNDPKRKGREFSCASCHDPHGSNNPRFFYYGTVAMESCAWCHGDKSGQRPDLKNVVGNARRTSPSTAGAAGAGAPGGGAGAPGAGSPGSPGSGAGSGGGAELSPDPFGGNLP